MYVCDFEYDGRCLSEYGFVVCTFGEQSDYDIASAGSRITFQKASRHSGKIYSLAATRYDECITATFDICKDPNLYEDLQVSNEEYRDLFRWLNRREFCRFSFIQDDAFEQCYFNASFNVEKVKVNETVYGMRLTMETDRPFGFGPEVVMKWSASAGAAKTFLDTSDEIGYLYPTITVKCKAGGDLVIRNETWGGETVVKNCSAGEEITFLGDQQMILSSMPGHDIHNDFNYEFPKVCNSITDRSNRFTFSLDSDVTLRYDPIVKDTP